MEGMEFYAYHGFYDYERVTGNKFSVDVKGSVLPVEETTEELDKTINYELIYQIVKEEMAAPCLLLETLAIRISRRLLGDFPGLVAVEVSVSKYNPPIGGKCEKAKITYKCQR